MTTRVSRSTALDGAVLFRVAVVDANWPSMLPIAPPGRTLTVAAGHADLAPAHEALRPAGYRFVGVIPSDRPVGRVVDVLVPAEVRASFPSFVEQLRGLADRVFDLRMGPVRHVFADEIELHRLA